jgi:DNA polymerase epsilon subunit 1
VQGFFSSLYFFQSFQVYRHIQRALTSYREEKKGPTMLCIQSAHSLTKLNQSMPVLMDFPEVPIHIADDASLLSGLEWQRNGARSMVRHYLNLNKVVDLLLDQCRYFHLPVGNMPADTVLFGADLFYARHLQKHNFVLWWSATSRPDLGGREADDSRLLAEFEDSISVVQNKPGFYSSVCVELNIDSLAVSALLQANRIQEMEGASSATTFDIIPQANLDDMIGGSGVTLPSYDETALCSAAFRVMRSMVNGWLREVSIHKNVFSDFQIVHFYRWVRSSTALLYDPALRRALNTLMRKLFLQIIAEFQRLGAQIVYADFNRVIICTGKKTVVDAIAYTDYVVQSIRNKELFHSVHLSYQQNWEFLVWLDTANYSGVRGKLPRELTNEQSQNSQLNNDDDDEIALEMNFNISEQLPEEGKCRENFENFIQSFMERLASKVTPSAALKSLSHHAYDMVQRMHTNYGRGKESPALEFIKALCRILAVDSQLEEDLAGLRRNMLKLVGVGDFSDLAVWVDPINGFTLPEVICKACNHCRDVELIKDKHRAMKAGK